MKDVVASADGALPTCVIGEVSHVHRESIADLGFRLEHRTDLRLSRRVTHRGADVVAPAQKLHETPAPEKAGTAGDQDRLAARPRTLHRVESMSYPPMSFDAACGP